MKFSLKLISLLLAAVFLMAGTMMVAFAEGEDGGDTGVDTGVDTGEVGGGGGGEDPYTGEDPNNGEIGGEDPYTGEDPNTGEIGGEDPYTGEDPNTGEIGGGDASSYIYDPDPLYYGDASNYDYNSYDGDSVTGAVSSQTTLYNPSGMTAEEAAPNQWSEITLDEKTVKTGVADFSAIKSNTETKDNGDLILYIGYLLIALSALGIIYFIAATIAQRKANKKAERMERRRASSAPAHSAAARMEQNERRASGTPARTSRFADEAPVPRRRVSKADTGEVYIPRRAAKR